MATNSCDLPAQALDPRILGPARTSFEQLPHAQQLQYTLLRGRTWQAFMGWCNFWLERARLPVLSDLSVDFSNGAVLSSLLEILSGKPVPGISSAGSAAAHVTNLESCFAFMRQENVLLLHIIQPQDIHDGKLTSVFALIWALIVYYGIVRPLSYEEVAPSELSGPISLAMAEKLLVRRVNLFLTHEDTAKKKGKKKRKEAATLRAALFNYETALESGSLFSSLIAKVKPRLLAAAAAKGDGGKERKRRDAVLALDAALDLLRRKWGLPAFFTERDYAVCLREKKPVLAYITLCLHALRPAPSPSPSTEPNNNVSGVSSSSSSAIMAVVGTNSGVIPSGALLAAVDSASGLKLVEDMKLQRSNSTGLPSSRSGVHPLAAAAAVAASSDSKNQAAAAGGSTASEGTRKRSLSEVLRRSALGLLNRAVAMADDKQAQPQPQHQQQHQQQQEEQQPQAQVHRTDEADASQVEPPRSAKKQKARKRRPKTLDDRPRRRKKDKEAVPKAEVAAGPATESQREILVDPQASAQQEQPLASSVSCEGVAAAVTTDDITVPTPPVVTEQPPQPRADDGESEQPPAESGPGAKKKTKRNKQRRERKEAKAAAKEERKLRRGKDQAGSYSAEVTPVIEITTDSAAKEGGPASKESGGGGGGGSGLTVSGLLRKKDRKEKDNKKDKKDTKDKKAAKKQKKGSKLMNLITRPRGKSRADTLEAGWVEHAALAARTASLAAQEDAAAAAAPPEPEALSCITAIGHTSSNSDIRGVGDGSGGGGDGGDGSATFAQRLEALARVILDQRPVTQTESLHKKRFEEMETTIEQVVALVQAELEVWQKLRLAAARDSVAPTPAILEQASYEGSVRRALKELVVAQREVKRVVAISPLISSGSSLHPLWKQVFDGLQQLVNEVKADAGTASLRRRRDKGSIPTISLMSYSPVGETVDSSNGAGNNPRGNGIVAHKSEGELSVEGRQQPSRSLSALNNSITTTGGKPPASNHNGSTTAGGGERAGGVLLRLRSFTSADDASKRSAAVVPRAPSSYKPAREAKAKPTIIRSSTSDLERVSPGPPSGNGAQGSGTSTSEVQDKDRDRFWRSVRSANSNKKTPNGPEEPLVVTLCKQNIRASLQLLQSDVLSADAPAAREVGQGKAALSGEAAQLLSDLESVEGVLDKLFLGFSSVDSLKTHSLVDLTDFSKIIYDLVCLLKGVERAFRRSLLDFSLRSLGADSNLTRDKLAERNAGNLTIWKTIMRDSGSLLEETVLVLDSIRQNNVVKTMRLNAWQNLREKVALQVNRLKLDIKKDVPSSSSATHNSRSDASSEQDIMRMVEKEIAGLEVEVREEKQAAAEQEATSSAIAPDLLLAAGEGSAVSSSYTEMTSLLLGSQLDESVVSSTQQSENEQQMNEIFDFLHKKLADSGLARSRLSMLVAMPTVPPPPPVFTPAPITDALEPEPTLPAPISASGVAVFNTVPDVADLPPPPEEDDGADYYDVDEQPENQKMNNIFSKLQQKLANEGIKTIPPTPRFVSSAEQAVVTELVGSDECEDLQPLCAQATLPSPPSIEMLPSPRLMALSLRRGVAGSPSSGLAAVSTHLYHARRLPSRQQEQADADAIAGPRPPPSARGGRLDMCARCAGHIPDDQPRLLALGRVYHQPCLTCTGCGRLLEREFHAKEEATYCSECGPDTQPRQSSSSSSPLPPSLPDLAP